MEYNRKTKIIATVGPASCEYNVIKKLFLAGVDVFRLNFSHGDHEFHQKNADLIRKVEKELSKNVAIMMDLQGPKIRIGVFEEGRASLKAGAKFVLDLNKEFGNAKRVLLPHPEIFPSLKAGSDILIDDGRILLRVLRNDGQKIETEVINGGIISNKKGVNIPNIILPISALTEKDKKDINFLHNIDVDLVAISFVQKAEDILQAKALLPEGIFVVAKIEKPSAVENIDSILDVSDGIMIARGDLGVEVPFEIVPALQRKLIVAAREKKKPVIVATQMLESMTKCHVPTRAEASDVACAIRDGADAIMLSAETASGEHPEAAVMAMAKIAKSAEIDCFENPQNFDLDPIFTTAMAKAASEIVLDLDIKKIIVFTESGQSAINVSNARVTSDIVALTNNMSTIKQLCLVYGVLPIFTEDVYSFSQMVQVAQQKMEKYFDVQLEEEILILASVPFGQTGETNILHICHALAPVSNESA